MYPLSTPISGRMTKFEIAQNGAISRKAPFEDLARAESRRAQGTVQALVAEAHGLDTALVRGAVEAATEAALKARVFEADVAALEAEVVGAHDEASVALDLILVTLDCLQMTLDCLQMTLDCPSLGERRTRIDTRSATRSR